MTLQHCGYITNTFCGTSCLGYKTELHLIVGSVCFAADNIQLSSVPWRSVIIDEAHRLKNRNCKLLEGLNNLNMVSIGKHNLYLLQLLYSLLL